MTDDEFGTITERETLMGDAQLEFTQYNKPGVHPLSVGSQVRIRGEQGVFRIHKFRLVGDVVEVHCWGGSKNPNAQRSWRAFNVDRVKSRLRKEVL